MASQRCLPQRTDLRHPGSVAGYASGISSVAEVRGQAVIGHPPFLESHSNPDKIHTLTMRQERRPCKAGTVKGQTAVLPVARTHAQRAVRVCCFSRGLCPQHPDW